MPMLPFPVTKKKATAAPKADDEDVTERLATFDRDQRFGPSMGITRLERWERAHDLGLRPPPAIKALLLAPGADQRSVFTAILGSS